MKPSYRLLNKERGGMLVELLVGVGVLVGIVVALGQLSSLSTGSERSLSAISMPTFASRPVLIAPRGPGSPDSPCSPPPPDSSSPSEPCGGSGMGTT
jgi:hypothetical protein